jgi:hypothetical protein
MTFIVPQVRREEEKVPVSCRTLRLKRVSPPGIADVARTTKTCESIQQLVITFPGDNVIPGRDKVIICLLLDKFVLVHQPSNERLPKL